MRAESLRNTFSVYFGSFLAFFAGSAIAATPVAVPSPGEIIAAAPATAWVDIAASDLLVMDLVPDRDGNKRRVIIQLMPPPFSQGWIGNIRKLAAAHWWDGTSINRVQDNYVAQWGDADAEDKVKARKLPAGLVTVPESKYLVSQTAVEEARRRNSAASKVEVAEVKVDAMTATNGPFEKDAYATNVSFFEGFPIGSSLSRDIFDVEHGQRQPVQWPIHCYGMVGVGRDLSPNTGSGAELYTVIGHAPRHLDRNIALVGRVISGIENLSSLPRGTGPLGFYEKPEQRVGISSIRLASKLPAAEQPKYQYLSTESASFARYADARANRRDAFFIVPAGGADICNVPVPVRAVK